MATKPTITDIAAGGHYDASALNSRFNTLKNWFATVLGTDGVDGDDNTISANIDMDGNEITNLKAGTAQSSAARLQDITDASDLDSGIVTLRTELGSTDNGEGASLIGVEDSAANFAAVTVEDALAEIVVDYVAADAAIVATHDAHDHTSGAGGLIFIANDPTPATTVDATNTKLGTVTIPADTLGAAGSLECKFIGSCSPANDDCTVWIEWDGTATDVLIIPNSAPNSDYWEYNLIIQNVDNTAVQKLVGTTVYGDANASTGTVVNTVRSSDTADTTGAVVLDLYASAINASDSLTKEIFQVKLFPNI